MTSGWNALKDIRDPFGGLVLNKEYMELDKAKEKIKEKAAQIKHCSNLKKVIHAAEFSQISRVADMEVLMSAVTWLIELGKELEKEKHALEDNYEKIKSSLSEAKDDKKED